MTKNWLAVAAVLGLLAAAAPQAAAAEEAPGSEDPGQLAREGIERLMQALEVLIDQIPQYEMPVIEDNGDIIIRRKRDPEPPPEPDDEATETET